MAENSPESPHASARNSVKVNAARKAVKSVRIVDTDIVLVLDDGSKVYVRDGAIQPDLLGGSKAMNFAVRLSEPRGR